MNGLGGAAGIAAGAAATARVGACAQALNKHKAARAESAGKSRKRFMISPSVSMRDGSLRAAHVSGIMAPKTSRKTRMAQHRRRVRVDISEVMDGLPAPGVHTCVVVTVDARARRRSCPACVPLPFCLPTRTTKHL